MEESPSLGRLKAVCMWHLGTGFGGKPGSAGEQLELKILEGFAKMTSGRFQWFKHFNATEFLLIGEKKLINPIPVGEQLGKLGLRVLLDRCHSTIHSSPLSTAELDIQIQNNHYVVLFLGHCMEPRHLPEQTFDVHELLTVPKNPPTM